MRGDGNNMGYNRIRGVNLGGMRTIASQSNAEVMYMKVASGERSDRE